MALTVTGQKIKEVLKIKTLELTTVLSTFDESLVSFEGDKGKKDTPQQVMDNVVRLEKEVAFIQTLQSRYNLAVKVKIQHVEITLEEAVKLVGGAGRTAKRWKEVAKGEKKDRYSSRYDNTRDKDKEYAVPTISKAEALEKAKVAERYASAIRTAIATGNLQQVTFDDIATDLFA